MLGVEEVHEPLAECGTAPSSELRCVYYLIPLVLGTLIVLGMQAVLGHAVCPWISGTSQRSQLLPPRT